MSLFPSVTVNDTAYMFGANAMFSSEVALEDIALRIPGANLDNLVIRQSGAAGLFPVSVPALRAHIVKIILNCANKQVGWIAAGRSIALVANNTIGIFAIGQQPSNTMGANVLALSSWLDLAIAFAINRTMPKPAVIGATFINLLPESLRQWALRCGMVATNVLALLTREFGRGDSLPASAGAEYVIMEGHRNSSFLCLIRGRFAVAARYFYWVLHFKYSTDGRSNKGAGGA